MLESSEKRKDREKKIKDQRCHFGIKQSCVDDNEIIT